MIKNINLILALLGGIIIGIGSIVVGDDLVPFLIKVGAAIMIFDVLGLAIRSVLLRMMNKVDQQEADSLTDELLQEDEDTNEESVVEEDENVEEVTV